MMVPQSLPSPGKNQVSGGANPAAFKQQLMQRVQQAGVDPQIIAKIGQMAAQALKDKALYPMVKQAAIQAKLLSEKDFGQGINPKILAALATMGKAVSHA